MIPYKQLNKYSGFKFWKVLIHASLIIILAWFAFVLPLLLMQLGESPEKYLQNGRLNLYNLCSIDAIVYFKTLFFSMILMLFAFLVRIIAHEYAKGNINIKGRWINKDLYNKNNNYNK